MGFQSQILVPQQRSVLANDNDVVFQAFRLDIRRNPHANLHGHRIKTYMVTASYLDVHPDARESCTWWTIQSYSQHLTMSTVNGWVIEWVLWDCTKSNSQKHSTTNRDLAQTLSISTTAKWLMATSWIIYTCARHYEVQSWAIHDIQARPRLSGSQHPLPHRSLYLQYA